MMDSGRLVKQPDPAKASLPHVEDVPERGANEPRRLRRSKQTVERRHALKILAAVGVGAVAAVDALPGARPRKAAAYTEWTSCQGYYSATTTCVPSSAYFGSDNCAGTWHKNSPYWEDAGRYRLRYTLYTSTCNGRNAWRWYTSATAYKKCSDGLKETIDEDNGNAYSSTFSICRT